MADSKKPEPLIHLQAYLLPYEPKKLPHLKTYLKDLDYRKKDDTIICQKCEGTGKAYDWADRDPIEGWKMASKKTCGKCGGGGRLSLFSAMEAFTTILNDYNKSVDIWNKSAMFLNELRDQITPKMRKSLGLSRPVKTFRKVKYR